MTFAFSDGLRNLATEFADSYGTADELAERGREWIDGLRPRVNRAVVDIKAAADMATAIAVAPAHIAVGAAASVVFPASKLAIAVIGSLCETAWIVCRPSASAPSPK